MTICLVDISVALLYYCFCPLYFQQTDRMMKMNRLIERLNQEYDAICRELLNGKDLGEIVSATSTGDAHLHGESVTRLETSCGYTLYYKPRDCRSTDLLGTLTQLLFGEWMVPEQIPGDGYAFQKAVEKKRPETDAGRAEYYEKLGRLTALFYALGSSDMHNGNIICSGSSPIVIDTETLLNAKAEGVGGTGEFSVDYGEIFRDYETSVGECMVLPRFYGYMQASPLVPDDDCRPEGYEQSFIDGFQNGYRIICDRKEEVSRILAAYEDAPVRYLLRSTQCYAVKIQLYRNAQDAVKKENILKSLEKGLSKEDVRRWEPVLTWERECIHEGDVPYFCILAGGHDLMGEVNGKALIPGYLKLSPVEYAIWRMQRMCEHDLAVQTAYICASLKHIDGWEKPAPERKAGMESGVVPISAQEAINEVEETLLKLWEERIPLSDRCCLWHTPLINGKVGCLFALAEGFSGVAVFVHACAKSSLITGEALEVARELSAACFMDLCSFAEYLLAAYPQPPQERSISRRFNGDFGFKEGLSGFLWALQQLRDEDSERADRILEGFSEWHIEKDAFPINSDNAVKCRTDCLEGGNAGKAAELILCADEGSTPEGKYREAGIILKKMVDRKNENGCYQVFPKGRHQYFLPAFLRGNTGIAYILLQYAEAVFKKVRL